MARVARTVVVGYPHHITQRGNNQRTVFSDDKDCNKYLSCLLEYSRKYKLSILVYCLMPNHIHFIGIPRDKDSLAKTYNYTQMRYAQYFNKKNGTSGHLWQSRFYSCVLDDFHLLAASRYVERNPVKAKMVKKAWEWKWSSAAYHSGFRNQDRIVSDNLFNYIDIIKKEWRNYLEEIDREEDIDKIKKYTRTGFPLGSDEFIDRLEKKVGKKLKAAPRGRRWHRKAE